MWLTLHFCWVVSAVLENKTNNIQNLVFCFSVSLSPLSNAASLGHFPISSIIFAKAGI